MKILKTKNNLKSASENLKTLRVFRFFQRDFCSGQKSGFSLVEIVICAAIIGVSMIAILNAYSYFLRVKSFSSISLEATYLLEEGIEATRYLRDKGWTTNIINLSTSTNYYLHLASSSGVGDWQATTTKQIYDNVFERKIMLSDVYRNSATQNISSTGTIDTNSKKVTVSVSWQGVGGATTTKTLSTYLTNINDN